MKKFSEILVKGRYVLLAIFILFAGISVFLMQKVNVNEDMSKYLPSDSSMRAGVDILKEEFPNSAMELGDSTIQIMFKGLNEEQKLKMVENLQNVNYIETVTYEEQSEDYNSGEYTLYKIATSYDYSSDEMKEVFQVLDKEYVDNYDCVYVTDQTNEAIPPWMIAVLLVILVIIMLLMCGSWIEPFLFLASIGVAVLINMGTNAFLPSVSSTTHSIAAILQLVLSMDYSIILSNRYRQACKTNDSRVEAMKEAIHVAMPSVCSSALTTIVGLLALVFMSFKIGADLGTVLAKGVFISLICVFTVLPGLMLILDKLIDKTAKPALTIPMGGLAKFCYKARYIVAGVFAVLFVVLFILKDSAGISYGMEAVNDVNKVFPTSNSIVVMYENDDEENMTQLVNQIAELEGINSVQSYANTLGIKYTADELVGMFSASEDMASFGISGDIVKLLYYDCYGDKSQDYMTAEQFMGVVANLMMNETYAGQIDDETKAMFSQYAENIIALSGDTLYSASEMAAFIGGFTDQLSENYITLLYEMCFSNVNFDNSWTFTLEELFTQLESSAVFASLIPEEQMMQINEMGTQLAAGKSQLVGENYSLCSITTKLKDGSDEVMELMESLDKLCDSKLSKGYYMIGNIPMEYEMSLTFSKELNKITLITAVAIFIVVLISFRSILIPLVLVLVIQGSVYATMIVMKIMGINMMYLALLIVQSILMGATIDYAIVFASYFKEKRMDRDLLPALTSSFQGSIRTILTSSLIMIFATGILGYAFADPSIGQICHIIAIGVTCALVVILVFLPCILAALDRFITKRES
ncbi:efflux RND transporter permease subunit [Anaerosporobacter sp.]|uniref:efflux RND transporter permease subunit n=1 Tax=Anaerosporobacter sp. TaxID=1872529 RepID=UPI00286F0EB7|nr:MMPL family transporter [Anaerosporobacter sp.]